MKQCRSCGVEMPLSEFYKKGKGVAANCKQCTRAKYKTPEYREYQRRFKKDNTSIEQGMLNRSKSRAKKKGFEHNITIEDIQIPESCPLLGIPLFKGEDTVGENSPTLDRIDSSKGYIKGNVWVISYKANTIKSNATIAEIQLIASRLASIFEE